MDTAGDAVPSLLTRAGALVGLIATREDTLDDIAEAWDEVARIADERGIDVPAK
jgi:hypothetical protein